MRLAEAKRLVDALLGPKGHVDYEALSHLMEPGPDGKLQFTAEGAVTMHRAFHVIRDAEQANDIDIDGPVYPSKHEEYL